MTNLEATPQATLDLQAELSLLDSDATIVLDAGSYYVQLPFSHQLLATLNKCGYDAVRCCGVIRVAPSMPECFW